MAEAVSDTLPDEFTNPIVLKNGCYENPWKGFKFPGLGGLLKFIFISKDNSNIPKSQELDKTLPVEKPDFARLNNPPPNDIQVTWIGHASVLVQFDGLTVLTDPIFSQRASMSQWFGPKRFRPIPCEVQELPNINIVVISHTHYDHLDHGSVQQLNERFGKDLAWYVPKGTKQWMTNVGCENVTELTWWEESVFPKNTDVKLVCTPCQHWCKRNLIDTNKALWGSWIVKGPNYSFYFAGDTAYCEGFEQIGRKYGPFSFAAIPIGAYEPRNFMKNQHVNPEEAVKIHEDIKAENSLGIHWGTFKLTTEHYLEPRSKLTEELKNKNIPISSFFTLPHGRVHVIGKDKLSGDE
ncbi:N-acyl-phosphatidylethanolamine-hydrolyzing phospholipase D-like isoform X2 [Mytilus californianus]|uniref:N-acyl-phosphatidylethanolamine-hydrolyzing phospholipase D-like isoform X2 n=1 Tax=Mytilus californianus TaxID=6549 RepID=UPI002245A1D2|nr:N-acyl-phosphatidylethanolamine-hydrolyzing phospholipase D-like isoform X2 [Mytilus californianus]